MIQRIMVAGGGTGDTSSRVLPSWRSFDVGSPASR